MKAVALTLAAFLLVCGAVALSDGTTGGDIFAAAAFIGAGMAALGGLLLR